MSEQGVAGLVRNPIYLGQARYGAAVREDAHEAIVPRPLWQRCQGKARQSARTGLAQRGTAKTVTRTRSPLDSD